MNQENILLSDKGTTMDDSIYIRYPEDKSIEGAQISGCEELRGMEGNRDQIPVWVSFSVDEILTVVIV
jgi:hypothetical protein